MQKRRLQPSPSLLVIQLNKKHYKDMENIQVSKSQGLRKMSSSVSSLGLNSKTKSKTKAAPTGDRPWAGSYFNIPEPEANENGNLPTSYSTAEVEMHMIYRSLRVEKHIVQEIKPHVYINDSGSGHVGWYEPQELAIPLKEKAWGNRDCIAAVIYYSFIDSRTGERKTWTSSSGITLMMRIDMYTWQHLYEDGSKNGNPFIPECVKKKHPQMDWEDYEENREAYNEFYKTHFT